VLTPVAEALGLDGVQGPVPDGVTSWLKMGENWLIPFDLNRGFHVASSKSSDKSRSIAPHSCVALAPVLLRSGAVASDAFVVVDASPCCAVAPKPWFLLPCCAVASEPWFLCRRTLVLWLIACCALANTSLMDLGVHWVGAFTCGDVLLVRNFFFFAILKDYQLRSWAVYHSWSLK